MGQQPPAHPQALRDGKRPFLAGADELRRKQEYLTRLAGDLASGSWLSTGADQFQAAWARFASDTRDAAHALEQTAAILDQLASAIEETQSSHWWNIASGVLLGTLTVVETVADVAQGGVDVATDAATVVTADEAASAFAAVSDGFEAADAAASAGLDGVAESAGATGDVAGNVTGVAGESRAAASASGSGSAGSTISGVDAEGTTSSGEMEAPRQTSAEKKPGNTDARDGAGPMPVGIFSDTTTGDAVAGDSTTLASASTGTDDVAAGAETGPDTPSGQGTNWSEQPYNRRQLGNTPSNESIARVQERDEECFWCGGEVETGDHYPALAARWRDGEFDGLTPRELRTVADDPEAMLGSCRSCNFSRGAREPGLDPPRWDPRTSPPNRVNGGPDSLEWNTNWNDPSAWLRQQGSGD